MAWIGTDDEFGVFIDEHGLTFPQISDDAGQIYARFDVPTQPALVVVDTAGTVETLFGAVDAAHLDEVLAKAVDS